MIFCQIINSADHHPARISKVMSYERYKPFKSYFREDAVYNLTDSMIKESKCFSEMMKKPFNKELEMTEKHNEDFKMLMLK